MDRGSATGYLDERARIWTVVYLCVIAANGLAVFAVPGYAGRMRAYAGEVQKFFHMGMPQFPNAWLIGMASVVYVAVPIWFLVRRRGAFTAASQRER